MRYLLKITLVGFFLLSGCEPDNGPDNSGDLGSAKLVFPENNSECTEGTVLNKSESKITFKWETSQDIESYELNVRNLSTDSTQKVTSNGNEANVTLERNVPYEWFVISKYAEGEDLTSAKWRFYNAGDGVENYAPFPAVAIHPSRGQTLDAAGSINLEWQGNDVDNDISEYEVLFGGEAVPVTSLGVTEQNTISADVSASQTYYWRVITKDKVGNSSQSEIFEFRVL